MLPVLIMVVCRTGSFTRITLVGVPLIVVATVAVAAILPEVTVVVCRAFGVGSLTKMMLVDMPLITVGTVAVLAKLPEVTVVV